ncbi:hypothetical protein QLX67_06740 [Balneolaceae bacterium ANBcel3]|nr:hypothetical protein [Balneolaceae bacterium ANBcel3]
MKIDSVLPDGVSFFGYYNISPGNYNNEIVFCSVNEEINHPTPNNKLHINIKSQSKSRLIGTTNSWNWQQGCMLQWLPPKYEQIIFNDYDSVSGSYVCKIFNKEGGLIGKFKGPTSNISKCGSYALFFNYDRLSTINPSYGYNCKKDIKLPPDDKDGIWKIDLSTGVSYLIITLEQLKTLNYSKTMDDAVHKVNHIDINPTGTRFIFIHRWRSPMGRFHRLISADKHGKDLYILNGDRMTSHCCWYDDQTIISFCHIEGKGDGYYILTDKTHSRKLLSEKLPKEDGHPSVSTDKKWLLTDTYPDSARMSKLLLYNFQKDKIIELGRFYQPLRYKNAFRIDLHPKWGLDRKNIFFESGHNGKRQLYQMNIGNLLHNSQ